MLVEEDAAAMAELLLARLVAQVGKVGLLVRREKLEIEQAQELAVDAARGGQKDRQEPAAKPLDILTLVGHTMRKVQRLNVCGRKLLGHPNDCSSLSGLACSATFHHTPVSPSVCTEAGCRLTLFAPGPACLFPLAFHADAWQLP